MMPLAVQAENFPIDIGDRLELFVDDYLVESLENAEFRLHLPCLEEVSIRFDRAWEGRFSGFVSILKDDGVYRMYYRGMPSLPGEDAASERVTCYAESVDGIIWVRPDLNQHAFNGTKKNNIILKGMQHVSSTFAPFSDENPAPLFDAKFKAVGGVGLPFIDRFLQQPSVIEAYNRKDLPVGPGAEMAGLWLLGSDDGVNWRILHDKPVFQKGKLDSLNVVFYSKWEECYVMYFRDIMPDGEGGFVRSIHRSTSPDLLNWSDPLQMDFGDTPPEHLYINGTHPYFRAPHIYIGLAARYFPSRKVHSDETLAGFGVHPSQRKGLSETVLLTSRGGSSYERKFMEALIRPGLDPSNWSARSMFPVGAEVQTGPGEMSLYHLSGYGQHTSRLVRSTLRIDGYASLHAGYEPGRAITKPFVFSGEELVINFSTAAGGSLRIGITDEDGNPLNGFELDHFNTEIGDHIEKTVSWMGGNDLGCLAGKPVRLVFELKDADLYSIRFR
jgi:hypothetical protein